VVRVRRQGSEAFFPRDAKLEETDIRPMETLEFIFCEN
jgi:toluene monooxygenase system protein B